MKSIQDCDHPKESIVRSINYNEDGSSSARDRCRMCMAIRVADRIPREAVMMNQFMGEWAPEGSGVIVLTDAAFVRVSRALHRKRLLDAFAAAWERASELSFWEILDGLPMSLLIGTRDDNLLRLLESFRK